MPKDRLNELRVNQADNEELGKEEDASDILEPDGMEKFFHAVETIMGYINYIERKVEEVKVKHSAILSAPTKDQKLRQELEFLMQDIKVLADKVRKLLRVIENNLEEQEKSGASSRIQKRQHLTLSRRFTMIMEEYNRAQTDYKERCEARLKRLLEMSGVQEDVVEPAESLAIAVHGIRMNPSVARKTLDDIQSRHEDIRKLAISIQELHHMFIDMSELIDSQGEMVDHIGYNVKIAEDYVETANRDSHTAQRYRSKIGRKKLMIILCAILVLSMWAATYILLGALS